MKSTATQFESAVGGGKGGAKAIALFKSMGVNMTELKTHGHDMNAMLGDVTDHFNKMRPGAEKTYLATKLFGRGWQTLMPLLGQSSKALAEQRKEAAALGVTLSGNTSKNAMKLHEAQIKLKLATMGLKVQFTEHLAPALFKLFDILMKLDAVIMKNMGPAFKILGQIVKDVTGYFKRHHDQLMMVKDVVIAVAVAWGVLRLAILAAKVVSAVTNPWMLAMVAVVLIIMYLIRHWKQIKPVVMDVVRWVTNAWKNIKHAVSVAITATVNFVKAWWPLIVGIMFGPIALIVALIVKFHDQIIKFISSLINTVIDFVKTHWILLVALFGGPVGLIIGLFIKFHDQIIAKVTDVLNFVKGVPGKIVDAFTNAASTIISAITSPFTQAYQWLSSHMPHIKTTKVGPISIPTGISLQHGGIMARSGVALVGEAGPEIVHLPGGSRVQPHSSTSVGTVVPGDKAPSPFIISVQIQRQEIARAVGKFTSDKQARR
jgi:phage-related protein